MFSSHHILGFTNHHRRTKSSCLIKCKYYTIKHTIFKALTIKDVTITKKVLVQYEIVECI